MRGLLTRNDCVDYYSQVRNDDLVVEIVLLVVGLLRLIRLGLGGLRILGDRFEPSLLAPVQQLDDDIARSADDQHRQQHVQLHTGAEVRAVRVGDHEAGAFPQSVVRKGRLLVAPEQRAVQSCKID